MKPSTPSTPFTRATAPAAPRRRHGPRTWALALQWAASLAASLLLTACGGGDGVPVPEPAAPTAPATPTLGAAGGSVTGAGGVRVSVPAGALDSTVTVRIAEDATGAPPLTDYTPIGPVYSLTPHGVRFEQPAEVRIPFDASRLAADELPVLLRAQPGGAWQILSGARREGDALVALLDGFSLYTIVRCSAQGGTTVCRDWRVNIGFDPIDPPAVATTANSTGRVVRITRPTLLRLGVRYLPEWPFSEASFGLSYELVLRSRGGQQTLVGDLPAPSALPAGSYSAVIPVPVTALHNGAAQVMLRLRCNVRATTTVAAGSSAPVPINSCREGGGLPNFEFSLDPVQLDVAIAPGTNAQPELVPLITVQPQDLTVTVGATSAAFSAESVPGLHQWQESRDGGRTWRDLGSFPVTMQNVNPSCIAFCQQVRVQAPPQAATTVDVATAPVGAALNDLSRNGWLYRVRVSNDFGVATSRAARLNVLPGAAPTVLQSPADLLVLAGETASFTAVFTGQAAPEICWYVAGVKKSCSTGTSSTYSTPPLALSDNGAQVWAVATNFSGQATTARARLDVLAERVPATIVTPPQALTVAAGSQALFAAGVMGTAPLSYQWLRNGQALTGANTPLLQLDAVEASANGTRYALRVSNSAGSATSAEVLLTVTPANAGPGSTTPTAPVLLVQPASLSVGAGSSASLAVGASGSGPLAFQWQREGVPIAGATAAVLTLPAVTAAEAGSYRVVVSNAAGSVTSQAATLSVSTAPPPSAPLITTEPATQVVVAGSRALFSVGAVGAGPLAYQWRREGVPIAGATSAVLTLQAINSADVGRYDVVVSNAGGAVTSATATLSVLGAPAIGTEPADLTVTAGSAARFSVAASGDGLRYLWLREGAALAGATAASYTLAAPTLADNGARFSVIVYNAAGIVFSRSAVLTVQAPAAAAEPVLVSAARDDNPTAGAVQGVSASADGQRVAFRASGTDLVAEVGSNQLHAYLRRVNANDTQLINRSRFGGTSERGVDFLKLSGNGRYALFTSTASDLVADDTNNGTDVFLRDLDTDNTTRLNVCAGGVQDTVSGNTAGARHDLSADGRWVLIYSPVNLAGDCQALSDGPGYFVRDRAQGSVRRVALQGTPLGSNGALSADGSVVMVLTQQGPLLAIEAWSTATGQRRDVLLTEPVHNLGPGSSQQLAMSADGRYLALVLYSPSWFGGAAASRGQVVVYDTQSTAALPAGLTLISTGTAGAGDGMSDYPSISADGRWVGYRTEAGNLSGGLANGSTPLFLLHDRQAGSAQLLSRGAGGAAVGTQADEQAVLADGTGAAFIAPAQQMLGGNFANSWQAFTVRRP